MAAKKPSAERAIRARIDATAQDVGLRELAVTRAGELGVFGWVKRGEDEDVLVHAEGDRNDVEALIDFLREDSRVDALDVDEVKPEGHEQFAIRGVSAGVFVVQEHQATAHHFDLRLEVDGVMRSWAVPKGPSMDPAVKRMAIQVPDHSMEHNDFEGETEGGWVKTWDRGTYEQGGRVSWPEALERGHAVFVLHGERLEGGFALQRTGGGEKPRWLLIKRRDEMARPGSDVVGGGRLRPVRTISDDERRARLGIRHALADPAASVEEAAGSVVCLHATEPANVYLSAFARSGASRDEIDRALYEDRKVVRQLAMRRTLFAFPRGLLPAVRGSASARIDKQLTARLAKEVEANGLAEDGSTWVRDTCAEVLAQLRERPATTAQLRASIPALDLRLEMAPDKKWGGEFPIAPRVLSTLAAGGTVVRGRNDGGWKLSRPFWTLAADWLDEAPESLDERAGYAELVNRWLARFGPGTEADIVWWLGATKGAVRRALADIDAVAVELADGAPAWVHPEDTDEVAPPAPWGALLPALDPTTMGWKERGFYLGDHAPLVFDRNGNAGPTAWWDGRIVGGWTQERRRQGGGRPDRVPPAGRGATAERCRRAPDRLARRRRGAHDLPVSARPVRRPCNPDPQAVSRLPRKRTRSTLSATASRASAAPERMIAAPPASPCRTAPATSRPTRLVVITSRGLRVRAITSRKERASSGSALPWR